MCICEDDLRYIYFHKLICLYKLICFYKVQHCFEHYSTPYNYTTWRDLWSTLNQLDLTWPRSAYSTLSCGLYLYLYPWKRWSKAYKQSTTIPQAVSHIVSIVFGKMNLWLFINPRLLKWLRSGPRITLFRRPWFAVSRLSVVIPAGFTATRCWWVVVKPTTSALFL